MKVKLLLKDRYTIAAVMTGNTCPAELFITEGEAAYGASREGLAALLQRVAQLGLPVLSTKQAHEVNKPNKIYEFIKGDLRLFYFKGEGDMVVVCTTGTVKQGNKVNGKAVKDAIICKSNYQAAVKNGSLELVHIEE